MSLVAGDPQTKEERDKWADILRHTEKERENIFVCLLFPIIKEKEKT
jgi:hypothetical protein